MKYIILFLTLSIPFVSKADLGTCYCVKAEIEFEDGLYDVSYFKIGGYDFSIEKKEDQYAYWTNESWQKEGWIGLPLKSKSKFDFELNYDPSFSKIVLSLVGDSLKYHTDYIKLNYKVRINDAQEIELIGEQLIISKSQIKKLNVQRLMPCGIGTSVLTQLESNDKDWINEVLQVDYLGGPEMCGYESFHFSTPTEEVDNLQGELTKILEEYREALITPDRSARGRISSLQERIMHNIELLKKHQIIVMMSCSC